MGQAAKKEAKTPYEIGYGKPPEHSRFKKGQSGNPNGRPRRKHGDQARRIALQEAYRPVTVREGDGFKKMPAIQAVHRAQVALAAKGNGPAQRAFLRIVKGIEDDQHDLEMELLKVALEYQEHARRLERDVELGAWKKTRTCPSLMTYSWMSGRARSPSPTKTSSSRRYTNERRESESMRERRLHVGAAYRAVRFKSRRLLCARKRRSGVPTTRSTAWAARATGGWG
jgi:hypothetical protein